MKSVLDGRYSGVFASSGWNRRNVWSNNRKDENRALQKVTAQRQSTLGDIPSDVEYAFHRIFGGGGVSDAELATSADRSALQERIVAVEENYVNLSPSALIDATSAVSDARRLANTFPETTGEAADWRIQASAMMRRLSAFTPAKWPYVLVGGLAIGAVAIALFAPGLVKKIKG